MAKEKKFGTFPGVFTPSILTILGVIMYMRLSWVVGQVGFIGTLIIIVVAHIISITTGLSISSIATDKKIKAGGIYYILSRSLGLPMGGAIGIALFIGTALSISMYIVGFAENFLSIYAISEFLNLSPGVNSYRIVGTAVIVILVILAYISTSLVIKSQYFILGAIVLSIISIFVGFAIHPEFLPTTPIFFKAEGGESIEKVFAIFFPAVTGFTAGVAMSGDLKDPKKNIPVGTLLAIAVGFVVYIALTLGFGFFVNRNDLLSDTNIAMRVAWIPALVVAGIWGATLSSALGGILGGPRILQALSKDSVTPKLFAKGYGKTNEPRNALIMIFVIAEAGILIGNLNVIAGVVTMFFLSSYGFINLAYVLENMASTDFRPSFKISSIFGIVGFVFAFAIMFKLDVVSMLVAFVLIGLIYFILQRKQLKLDFGDVWQSVWISVVRKGLHILDSNNIEDRNWQPNIILFSGATDKRPHLIEFGRSLVGKFGFLSNFDLTVDSETDVLFPKHKQSIPEKKNPEVAVFTRRQSCKDVYDGIEMIVRTYGFSGLEPNTVVMGWGRQSQNPERFVKLIQIINDLDYNILLVDYDKRFGYGQYKQIDIWWRGAGNNGNFAITLAKFILASEKWENATVRLMIVNNEDIKAFYIYRQAKEILDSMRIDAEVRIINNEVEQIPFYDIISIESKSADVVFIGIPSIHAGEEKEFIQKTNVLLHKIGTVVLLSASSLFKDLNLGVNLNQQSVISASDNLDLAEEIASDLIPSVQPEFNVQIKNNFEKIVEIYDKTIATFTFKEVDVFVYYIAEFKVFINDVFNLLNNNLSELEFNEKLSYVTRFQNTIIKKVNKELDLFKENQFEDLKEMMLDVLFDYEILINEFLSEINTDVILNFDVVEFKIKTDDSLKFAIFKLMHKFSENNEGKINVKYTARSRKNTIKPKLFEVLYSQIEQIRIETLRFVYNFDEVVLKLVNQLNNLKIVLKNGDYTENEILKSRQNFEDNFIELEKSIRKIILNVAENRKVIMLKILNNFLENTNALDKFYFNRIKKLNSKKIKVVQENISVKNEILFSSFELFINNIQVKNKLNLLNIRVLFLLDNFMDYMVVLVRESCIENNSFNNLEFINKIDKELSVVTGNIKEVLVDLPDSITIIEQNSLNDSFYKNFNKIESISLALSIYLESFIEENVLDPLKKSVEFIKNSIKTTDCISINKITGSFSENIEDIKAEVKLLKLHKLVEKTKKKRKL